MSQPFYKTRKMPSLCDNASGKCGEITFCLQVGKRFYALNCLYCSQICIQWDDFINHVEVEHEEKLQSNYLMQQHMVEVNVGDNNPKETIPKQSAGQCLEELAQISQMYTKTEFNYSTTYKLNLGKETVNDKFVPDKYLENEMLDAAITDQTCDNIDDQLYSDDFESCTFSIQSYHSDDVTETGNKSNWEETNDGCDDFDDISFSKRSLTQLIIKCYKEQSSLWRSTEKEQKNSLDHSESYMAIARQVNERMHTDLNWSEIKKEIENLRSKFQKEHTVLTKFSLCHQLKNNELIDVLYAPSPSWLYEEMSFLKQDVDSERKISKWCTKALANTSMCYLPLPKHSIKDNKQLIELYKSYPCLWDVNHIGYRFKNQRLEGFQELLDAVNQQMELHLTLDDLQKKLYYIRSAFTQEKHRQFECERLQRDFKPKCMFYEALAFLKDSVGPFKCESCEKLFNGPDQYKKHKSTHDGLMPFSCPICHKGFMKVGNCTVHLRRHTKDYQFACNVCGNKYATSTDLNVHRRHHTGEKPYICEVCGQSFRTWTLFDTHKRRHDQRRDHKCTICSRGFYESNKLKDHMKSHMNVRDKVCNVCGKSFTCTKYLSQHKQIHALKKAYTCKICAKTFAQYSGLSGHMKTHGTAIHAVLEENILDEG